MNDKTAEARKLAAEISSATWPDGGETELVFRMSVRDLQPGADGEVVLFNDSAFRDMVIEGVAGSVERGTVRSHVTAEGVDVAGCRFLKFENGLVIFHAADTSIELVRD